MRSVRSLQAIGIVLATLASGCAGSVKLSSAKMCAAHGGTFDTTNKTCTYTPSTRSAQQICQLQGGWYDPTDDVCSYNP